MSEIPIVDFKPFLDGEFDKKLSVSKEIFTAIKKYGFVYLKNYGIAKNEIETIFSLSKEFFNLPIDVKQSVKKSPVTYCGYDKIEVEKLSKDRPGDLKESYMIKQDGTPWPDTDTNSKLKNFKETILDFHKKCYELAFNIFRSIMLGLNVDPCLFDDKFSGECTVLRLLNYPPLPQQIQTNQMRCGEHTDYGGVSFLFQDSVGGLEIKTAENIWLPVPVVEDTILVNIGDSMELWTNGFLQATPHRVVNPNDQKKDISRYSIAFFFDPDLKCELKPLKEFSTLDYNSKFPNSKTYEDHLKGKYSYTYSNFI